MRFSTNSLLLLSLLSTLGSQAATFDEPEGELQSFGPELSTLWLERSAVLSFDFGRAAEMDTSLAVLVDDESVVRARGEALVLEGERFGSLRLHALAEGRTRVRVGEFELEVLVKPLPVQARLMNPEPEIVAPAEGCVLWGSCAVACEMTRDPGRSDLQLVLELPSGERLSASSTPARPEGPTQRALFELDTKILRTGPQTLRALVLDDEQIIGEATRRVTVVRDLGQLQSGECEAALELPRPEAFGENSPRIGGGAGASGDRFVMLPTPYPQWVLPLTIEHSGRYQLIISARGDFAGGAFPSVGVSVDRPNPIRSATRLVHHDWHRMPVGPPIELEAGERAIGLRFLNELNVGTRSNRDLYIDRWELLPIPDSEVGLAEASMMMAGSEPSEAPSASGHGLWVALDRPLEGLSMNGRLRLVGSANWSGPEDSAAPQVDLMLDGKLHESQQAAKPTFLLERAHLGAGEHRVKLVARLPDGRRAETPEQRLHVPGPVAQILPRERTRFSVLDEAWGTSLDGALLQAGEEPRQRVAAPKQRIEAILELPEQLEGTYQLLVEARGPAGDNQARIRVRQKREGDSLELGVQHWWSDRPLGQITLESGPKQLFVTLEPAPEDPVLRVRSLILESLQASEDSTPPVARILYPAPDHLAHGVDALVVEAFDDDSLRSADVLIDGQLQGTYGHLPPGAGHLVLPLLLRNVEPGLHTMAVRVVDSSGNLGESESQSFEVTETAPLQLGPYPRAIHLLNRLAFGPDPRELAELLTLGERAWLARSLESDGPGDLAAREWPRTNIGDALAYNAERLTVSSALRTDNPVRSRFVLWSDNHFSTWAGKTGMPAEWGEHQEFARLGMAPFPELLLASATSANMLRYLDQSASYAGRLNENYARELLELHTVGVDGGYTQEEVTGLAHLLCGVTVSQEAPSDGSGAYLRLVLRSAPDLSDGQDQVLLGRRFEASRPAERFDRFLEVLELLANHPSTAQSVATQLAEHYVASPAPADLVEALANVFLRSGGDFREMLAAMVEHPEFWDGADDARLTSPLEYGLRTARIMGYPQVDWSICEFLRNSGMGLFDRATPDGYPDDDVNWADTNGLMQRWRWVQNIPWAVRALVPNDSRRYYGGDPHEWRQRVVDLAAVRLTGHMLGAESNEVALTFLAEEEGNLSKRVDSMTLLICRLPEANLK